MVHSARREKKSRIEYLLLLLEVTAVTCLISTPSSPPLFVLDQTGTVEMNYQQHLANSAAIRSEIQRFESVHPNIYSIYELLERVEEPLLQNQIREHVIAIEGKKSLLIHPGVEVTRLLQRLYAHMLTWF